MRLTKVMAASGAAAESETQDGAREMAEAIRPPIDINAAGVDELTRLPGVGAVTARRIVEFRGQHGPFRRVEDLMKVKGIGEKSFQKLRRSITVGESGA